MNEILNKLSNKLSLATITLAGFAKLALKEGIEVKRINVCLLSFFMVCSSLKGNFFKEAARYIACHQQNDGGWLDVEETILSMKLLLVIDNADNSIVERGNKWLLSQRNHDGGWGRTNRDTSRILITGLLLHLLPELSDRHAVNWLMNEWKRDLQSDTRLTYKGAFFLLGLSASGISINDCSLIEETYSYLAHEQNDDGGFGPWKDHPIGSDPWSTGILLLGLLSYPELIKREVIEKAVNWLDENQLPNGLWAYHYIEEGSAYAYWGLVEALKYLAKEPH